MQLASITKIQSNNCLSVGWIKLYSQKKKAYHTVGSGGQEQMQWLNEQMHKEGGAWVAWAVCERFQMFFVNYFKTKPMKRGISKAMTRKAKCDRLWEYGMKEILWTVWSKINEREGGMEVKDSEMKRSRNAKRLNEMEMNEWTFTTHGHKTNHALFFSAPLKGGGCGIGGALEKHGFIPFIKNAMVLYLT